MAKRVIDVGNCALDHGSLCDLIEGNFDAQLVQAHSAAEALELLAEGPASLVLVNRVFDRDGSQGLDLVRSIKADPRRSQTPVMLLTNYPDAQQAAVESGAEEGFGKRQLRTSETLDKLGQFLA